MTTYNDLEIKCLVDAVDRAYVYQDTPLERNYSAAVVEDRRRVHLEQRHQALVDVLRETSHVLELLAEPAAAQQLLDISVGLAAISPTAAEELADLKEDVDDFLRGSFFWKGEKSIEAMESETWIPVPDHATAAEATKALADLQFDDE